MVAKLKSYKELKQELDEVLAWFEQDDIDVDEALVRYREASELISQLESLLESTSLEVRKLKTKS